MPEIIENWTGGVELRGWTEGVYVEEAAKQQLRNISVLPFIAGHIAVMPDCHLGNGATVGSVIPARGAIIPAAVGVDIGCVDSETEYLTPSGWKKISEYSDGDQVLVYDEKARTAYFEAPQQYICKPSLGFHHFKTKYGIDQKLSGDHRMLTYKAGRQRLFDVPEVLSADTVATSHHERVLGFGNRIKTTPETVNLHSELPYSDAQLRVMVMTAADCQMVASAAILKVAKIRKLERAKSLLQAAGCGIVSERLYEGGADVLDRNVVRFRPVSPIKSLTQLWGASVRQLNVIADELLYWDGNHDDKCFYTRLKEEADFAQWAFLASGKRAVLRADVHADGVIDYRVFAHDNTKVGIKSVPRTDISFAPSEDGLEYCFTVSTSFFLIRRGGVTALTGNCGMQAVRTSLTASQLPDSLADLRTRIEHAVPHGGLGPSSGWGGKGMPNSVIKRWADSGLEKRFDALTKKHPKLKDGNALVHLGSLGGGNHFIEVCIDQDQRVWVMLHSGSRGIGNLIGRMFIERAKEMMLRRDCKKPLDKELAWFEEDEPEFKDYVEAVSWAQDFARQNRDVMMLRVLGAMRESGLPPFQLDKEAVNCHHNFVEREYHFGQWVYLTRKGAVSAKEGELGIIPGSMGAKSFIVRGKGNADSYCSCSHGAGRMMSRTEAKRRFTVEDQIAATEGVECRKDAGVIDEIPLSYKNIDDVMAAQSDLVDIVATLKQVLCVKG